MRILATALAIAAAAPAIAGNISAEQARTIVSEGQVLSSAPVSARPVAGPSGPLPSGDRSHEMFVLHGGSLYLCYLVGSTNAGFENRISCFGNSPDRKTE